MVNIDIFQRFVPLASLVPSDRAQLAKRSRIVARRAEQALFRGGELAPTVCYLISGRVSIDSGGAVRTLDASDEAARQPLAPGAQRSASVTCLSDCEILHVDREQLDLLLTWAQTGTVEVHDISEGDAGGDWMTALLQSAAFAKVPAGNIAQIFASMEPVHVEAGAEIIRQGAPGDYYYVLTEGRCQIVRQEPGGIREQELAQRSVGECFGEEALVSDSARNATVRALTRCSLMRLSRSDFNRLLKAPLLTSISMADIPAQATKLDVRLPDEFMRGHLPGAVNIPLMQIREAARALHRDRVYVVYCDTGRRSASAAFLLSERGFDARLLVDGVPESELSAVF